MFYKELRIINFKRFAGTNIFPLMGNGNVTIIAAKNGVGKTTVLDAFNLVLHGSTRNQETILQKQVSNSMSGSEKNPQHHYR